MVLDFLSFVMGTILDICGHLVQGDSLEQEWLGSNLSSVAAMRCIRL